MNHFSFSSLRFRLILLVLLAVIPALGLTFYAGIEQRRHASEHVQADSLQLTKHVLAEQERIIEGVRQSLFILVQLPQVRECNKAACSRLFADLLKQNPQYLNIGGATLDGNIFASAIPITRTVNIFDRPYFQQALKTRKFAIGEYQIGRIVGKPVINFGYPVIGETGNVTAVVYVALDLTWLNQLAAQVQLPNGSTFILIDHKGTILAHYPEAEKWVGKIMQEASIVNTILAQGQGMAETMGLDGIQRLYTFTSVSKAAQTSGKVYIAVGIPSSVAFAQVNRILIRNLILLGMVALLALVAAWIVGHLLVLRHVNPLVNAARRLSSGDLSVRTGITYGKGELSQLARTFDEMVSSLEHRETDRKRAEDALRESERKFRDLYDHAPLGYHEYDIEGRITNVNQTDLEMLGYTVEEMIGQPIWKLNVGEEIVREQILAKLAGTLPPGKELERTYRRKDGTTFPVLIEDRLILDENGQITGIRCTIQDITERKRADEALQKSEKAATRIARENTIVAEIGRIISSSPNIDEVYERFAEEAHKLIPFDRIAINVANPDQCTTTVTYTTGVEIADRSRGKIIPLGGTLTEEVMRTRKSHLIQEEENEVVSRFPGLLLSFQSRIRSLMAIPLISKDEVIGVLHLRSTKPKAYTEEHLKIAERVGNHIAGAVANAQLFTEVKKVEEEREKLVLQLQNTLAKVKRLRGLIPICASCKKIRDDKGYWNQIEVFIRDHSEADFSHGICPDCMKKLYGDLSEPGDDKKKP